jgi:uncharacterized protein (TIRG00374 family)
MESILRGISAARRDAGSIYVLTNPTREYRSLRSLMRWEGPRNKPKMAVLSDSALHVASRPRFPDNRPNMDDRAKQRIKKTATFVVRWGIAVVGIWYVISHLSWHDRVLAILNSSNIPQQVNLSQAANDDAAVFHIVDPVSGAVKNIGRDDVVNEPDKANMTVIVDGQPKPLLGLDLIGERQQYQVSRFLVAASPAKTQAEWVSPSHVMRGAGGYELTVPHPRVEVGVLTMTQSAFANRPWFLIAAILVYPLTYIITAIRWHELLKVLDVHLPTGRIFVLNMVGAFYNTFMPGSTGGDVLKAYYVAKQTHHRSRAVMSVLVDRIIGLLALVILGGVMAALQWHIPQCRRVAMASSVICFVTALSLLIFFEPHLRKLFFVDAILHRLPMQRIVCGANETMFLYGRRPGLLTAALLVSFPVHMVVVLSALLAGIAFRLNIPLFFYWTAVPVIVLSGAIPISPQGAGVMEFFAIKLTAPFGTTIAQAFALTMSIRMVQILWNLSGGFFVFRGGYHAPSVAEQKQVEEEDDDDPTHIAA